ncbi:MAG: dTMP kinase [Bradymonadales bacterium]|jgi:dTMP kinase
MTVKGGGVINNSPSGILIALEGIDGSGKSTQAKILSAFLSQKGIAHDLSSEPTRGEHGMQIRQARGRLSAAEERTLFLADRVEHYETRLKPALEQGKITISDRYFYSSIAYQSVRAKADERSALMREIEAENRALVPEADILIYFDISPETAAKRLVARAPLDAFENLENQKQVYKAYAELIKNNPCLIRLDAEQELDIVSNEMLAALRATLHKCFQIKID